MAKPILIIGIGNPQVKSVTLNNVIKKVKEAVNDEYYVLVYTSRVLKDIKFEVFYEKDFNEVKYEELKQLITNAL